MLDAAVALTVGLLLLGAYYVRFKALQWLRTDRSEHPRPFYLATMVGLIASAFVILWRLYTDYAEISPVLVVAWLIYVMYLTWVFYRVASQDRFAQEVLQQTIGRKQQPPPQQQQQQQHDAPATLASHEGEKK